MTEAKNPYQEVVRMVVETPDLHRSAIVLFLATAHAGGEARVSELAVAMKMPRNTAVKAATDLVEAGLCTRKSGTIKIKLKL